MDRPAFQPGFRFSGFDLGILVGGAILAIVLGRLAWWAALFVGLVVLHFFLFCNVFRIARAPELIWGGVFVMMAAGTLLTEIPGWPVTVIVAVALSSFLIWRETRKEDYHGVCWERWNPGLRDWWEKKLVEGRQKGGGETSL